jgi:hypothetical protein
MDFDVLIGAGIGAGWTAAVWTGGYLLGLRHKRPRQIQEICQCDHPSSMHDRDGCREVEEVATKWDSWGNEIKWGETRPCQCIRYVGPHSSYVPELEGSPREQSRTDGS